ncbi:MAG: hypothetical protein ACI8XB_000750 [Patiriisocius sp.]|jgi:hypothetical protein
MNTLSKNIPLLLLFLCVSISNFSQQVSIYENDYSYDVESNARLEINSTFTDVTLESWDKNEVHVRVYAKTTGSTVAKSDRLMEKIRIDVSGSSSVVDITSKLQSNGGNTDKSEFDIRISIQAPRTTVLNFDCQFGDVNIPDWDGRVDIEVKFGDLDVKSLSNTTSEINLQYTDFNIDYVSEIEIESSFSDIYIENVERLDADSQYDDYHIESVDILDGDFRFSDLNIGELKKELELDSQYGGVEVERVFADFDKIIIDNQFGEVKLNMADGVGYYIEVDLSFASFSCDGKSNLNYKKEGFNDERYWGQIGKGDGRIEIDSKFGGVKIK